MEKSLEINPRTSGKDATTKKTEKAENTDKRENKVNEILLELAFKL